MSDTIAIGIEFGAATTADGIVLPAGVGNDGEQMRGWLADIHRAKEGTLLDGIGPLWYTSAKEVENMRKQRIEYDSPIDALVAMSKKLSVYENRYRMASEDFYDAYRKGQMEDSVDVVEWANDYQHYMAIKLMLEERLRNVA